MGAQWIGFPETQFLQIVIFVTPSLIFNTIKITIVDEHVFRLTMPTSSYAIQRTW
jgi:hypothetical protein